MHTSENNFTENRQTLHDAVRNGDIQAVRQFFENNADVNEKDSAGNTPLLLTICIKHEEIYNTIVRYLIENGADVNVYNKGFTPLYNAVFYKREESVKMLLEKGAWLRPCHRNELHLLAESGADNILQLILEDSRCSPDIINRADEEGRTSVYIAARNGHKTCVKLLVSHGGDLAHIANNGHSVVDAIFDQFTKPVEFFLELFNETISMSTNEKDDCIYHIDFDVLSPKNRQRQMDVISNLLVVGSDDDKTEVLQHPTIELFLILKWAKICYLFYLWIAIYIIFAVSLAVFINLVILHSIQGYGTLKLIIKYLLILSAAGLLGHAILQCLLTHRNYLRRYEMWMNLICTTLSLVTALMADISSQSAKNTPNWVLHVTSIGVLLAWIELMLLIGRLPTFGYYALMFAAVLQNVVKVLFAFLCLVIGFALSFSIQFHDYEQFSDPWRALVKTTVMMMGEFEYSDLFSDNTSTNDLNRLPTTSRFIFLMFIILTSIVLMNLMIGLAVSDIQGLQKESHARKVEKQAEFLCQLEKVISSKQFNSKYVPVFIKKVFVKKSFIDNKYEVKCSAEFLRAEKLPRRLIESIVSISKSRKQLIAN